MPSEAIRSHVRAPAATSGSPASRRVDGAGARAGDHQHGQAGAEREPRGLYALFDRAAPGARAEAACRPSSGAVGQNGAQPGGDGEQRAADGEAARGTRPRWPTTAVSTRR